MINIDALLATPGSLTGGRTYEEVLRDARNRISVSDHWTQEAYARNSHGTSVRPASPYATCWCMLGSIALSSNKWGIIPPPLMDFLEEMRQYVFSDQFQSIGQMNDYVSHDIVMNFMDTALAQFNKG